MSTSAGPVSGVAHFGLTVSDLDVAIDFWERFLGQPPSATSLLERPYVGRLVGMPGIRIQAAFFELAGGIRLELLGYRGTDSKSGAPHHSESGHAHVCLWTLDAGEA